MLRTEQPLTIAVAGATGRLGLPVALRLLARGHRVRVLSRNPGQRNWPHNAEPVRGDFDDPSSLRAAFDGVDAVFAAGTAHRAGPGGEARHGITLAESAAEVPHLVYVSGAGAEQPTSVPVFESKREVERRIAQLRLPATVLAPVYFMENALNPWNIPALERGKLVLPLPGDLPLQQVAIDDIAAVAVLALERPAEFTGRRIELASDAPTGEEAAVALTRATGRRYEFERLSTDFLGTPMRQLFEWLEKIGNVVQIDALCAEYPAVGWRNFAQWALTQKWPAAPSGQQGVAREG